MTRDEFWGGHGEVRMSVRELATALGVSSKSIYRAIASGMPARRRGNLTVLVRGHVREWLVDRERVVNQRLNQRVGRAG